MKKILDADKVPEVKCLIEETALMDEFKERNAEFMEEFRERVRSYNAALDAADKVLRAQEASSGPFDMFHCDVKYDADRLFSEVGEKEFKELGGTVHPATVYRIDKVAFEALVQVGRVSPELKKLVEKRTPKYHKPKPFEIP